MRNILIFIAFFIFVSLPVKAIDLKSYVEQVLAYNLEIKSAKEDVVATLYNYKLVKSGRFPQLSASLSAAYNLRRLELLPSVGMERYSVASELTLSQNIYNGSLQRSSEGKMSAAQEITLDKKLLTIENIIVAANLLYWRNVASAKYLEIAEKYLDIISKNYELIKFKYSEGVTTKNDLLMMERQREQARYNLEIAQKNYDQLKIEFNSLRGNESSEKFYLHDSIVVEKSIMPKHIDYKPIIKSLKEYRIEKLMNETVRLDEKINRAQFLPKISLGVSGGYGTRPLNIDGSLIVDGSVFFSVSTPLFGWGKKRFQRVSDRSLVQSSLFLLQKREDDLEKDININFVALNESYKQLSLTRSMFEIANKSLSLSTFSYNEGVTSIIELLSAQIAWLSAYNSMIGANLGYRVSEILYLKSIGAIEN